MKHFHKILLIALIAPSGAMAQSWCPSGATWTYSFSNGWTHEGFVRFTYIGDTIVGGINAKHIDQYAEGLAMGDPFYWVLEPFITAVNDQLITYWNGTSYDTLYNFAASPGDHWRMAPFLFADAVVNVLDSGTTSIEGLSLRYLVIGNNGIAGDTIVERLGGLHRYMLPWIDFTLDAPGGPLRCYSDLQIDYQSPWWEFGCTSFLEIDEALEIIPLLHPNPGTDHFTLQLPSGDHKLTIVDAVGGTVLKEDRISDQAVIDASSLRPGIYMLQITDRSGRTRNQPWIKE
ncbi:MAG: T9SS type A sorting domain-containing protein [Bacteroidota bacterium]|nr:T9SS type A sorting domain-containing protein [Bacteroidota bacterium]